MSYKRSEGRQEMLKKFPEYQWIQDRIDDLNKERETLEEIGRAMVEKGPQNIFSLAR